MVANDVCSITEATQVQARVKGRRIDGELGGEMGRGPRANFIYVEIPTSLKMNGWNKECGKAIQGLEQNADTTIHKCSSDFPSSNGRVEHHDGQKVGEA